VPRILHISDPHLGKPEEWQRLGDDKSKLFRQGLATTQDVLKDTLRAFTASLGADRLDAIVLSGDITNKAREDGYEKLDELIGILPVDKSRVVVVPGNHDVVWDSPEGSAERYKCWHRYVRQAGYVTPLLDGYDFEPDGSLKKGMEHQGPVLVDEGFVVVALNSSNFCGAIEDATKVKWDKVGRYSLRNRDEIKKGIKRLRQHDAARISPEQLRALTEFLRDEHPDLLDPDDQRIRIAVLHHHLLPVSQSEEVKTFESIVNLAEVRTFLANLGIHVVLHGHKHHPALYYDYKALGDRPLGPQRRTVVVGGPGLFNYGASTFRILDFQQRAHHERGNRPWTAGAPTLDIEEVNGLGAAARFRAAGITRVDLWRSDMEMTGGPFTAIYGDTREEVYERLQSTFDKIPPGKEIGPVLCVVRTPQPDDESTVPAGYPPVDGSESSEWFKSMVEWWQMAESEVLGRSKATAFNHGQRIYGKDWNPGDADAVQRAADLLHDDPETTRSLAILVDPRREAGRDELDGNHVEFPCLVTVQLRLVEHEGGRRLDCLGYFRKQDIRHWWPVNVAELARIQRRALERLGEHDLQAKRGHIVTFAAAALVDETLPSLKLARIDRLVDEEKGKQKILKMAYGVFHPKEPGGDAARDLWKEMFEDLRPVQDGSRRSVKAAAVGLKELLVRLKDLEAVTATGAGDTVLKHVKAIGKTFEALDRDDRADDVDTLDVLDDQIDELFKELERRFRTISPSPP
jgi:3',5'-cyclic AMP phosphodiesterase CpdA